MAASVLPFVRGIDCSNYDFKNGNFPETIGDMVGLRWLKLDQTGLTEAPEELGKLQKLEHLSLKRNKIDKVYGEVTTLPCLRSLNLRYNCLRSSSLPQDIFQVEELTTLDLSHNNLRQVPDGLERAKSLLVLNLSHNNIEAIPSQLFVQLTDLLFLDLSHNRLETLPPQTRRLVNLQTLILNGNPMANYQMRQLPSLTALRSLQVRDTQRSVLNIPSSLEALLDVGEVDLSQNGLSRIPDGLFVLPTLRRLNMSNNIMTELHSAIDLWSKLETVNLSRNQLRSLPPSICLLSCLRRLFIDSNNLESEGLPAELGRLPALEIFSASDNKLETIPDTFLKCLTLKKLILINNRLRFLPKGIQYLPKLELIETRGNPDFKPPPKPNPHALANAYYNIDFSLQHQLRLASAAGTVALPTPQESGTLSKQSSLDAGSNSSLDKDSVRKRGRRGRHQQEEADQDQAKILKGLKDVAKDKNHKTIEELKAESLKPRKWVESLEKPTLDYSEFFEEDVGQIPGLTIWEIENFLPCQVDESVHGKFYEADCYIVLKTFIDESGSLSWKISFWIGEKATLDKKACAAIHAVNLRNFLGAQCRTIREEQADESPEFIAMIDGEIVYLEGCRTASGFFTVDEIELPPRLYRIHAAGPSIHLEPVAVHADELDPRHVFLLDAGKKMFIWTGLKSKNTLRSKTRLLAEKINKEERKGTADIIVCAQGKETDDWWDAMSSESDEIYRPEIIREHVTQDFVPFAAKLYRVGLGMGYLELPQVELTTRGKLEHKFLETNGVYLIDCLGEVFIWIGKQSTRLVRAAALKLAHELTALITRPAFAVVTKISEESDALFYILGTEPMIFKTKFVGWNDVIAVDFTRTADSVRKTGADLGKWASEQQTKVDISALFTPRQPPMSATEAQQLSDDWNEDLEAMEAFVLENKKFVRLPEEDIGHFYSGDCYVFLCRYWIPATDVEQDAKNEDDDPQDDFQCVVYFWQGRDASDMGWLTFTFSLQKKFESLFGSKLEVVRTRQQQENLKFLAHFHRKFVIHRGKRKPVKGDDWSAPTEFFQIRSSGSTLCTRCIQIQADSSLLNSCFCYILKVPFDKEDRSGIVYVWVGNRADPDEARITEEIAREMYDGERFSLQVLNEGEEPDNFFWVGLGERKPYDTQADFLDYARLFRCSNERGYFAVSEKCSDFCQDDLADEDNMLLDNGDQVFLWLGSRSSEVEVKLTYKAVQVYMQHLRVQQPQRPRQLFLTLKFKETKRFTKCFHGWSTWKLPV
uniref:Gelsolin-like domain-containing protein n=1 Tax=Daphnia galeata TaxID=27404 RepID=A0A8J2WSD7_9CRUS|nr:unnamed protein product [Daphnia galeata]